MNKELIAELKEELNRAVCRKDVPATVAVFAPGAVMFALAPPLQFIAGKDNSGANDLEEWYASFKNEIGLQHTSLEISAGEDIAFCHCLEHLTGQRTDGSYTDLWYRETLGFRKEGGAWKIAHQHQSVPILMDGSDKAAVKLKP